MKILKASSPNFDERRLPIDSIIVHYTDMVTAEEALAWLSNPFSKVSSHYLIGENGKVYQLVDEDKRAWHAGESFWQGYTDLNSCSIGIELANPGHTHGYVPFPEAQIEALLRLCEDIRTRWDIPPARILGHSDVAPQRKQDPGHLFPWETLAKEGLGLWPTASHEHNNPGLLRSKAPHNDEPSVSVIASSCKERSKPETVVNEALTKIGYETISPTHTLLAFQRHFQPHKVDGIADKETISLLQSLLKA